MAVLHAKCILKVGNLRRPLHHQFALRLPHRDGDHGRRKAIVPSIMGRARVTYTAQLMVDPTDPGRPATISPIPGHSGKPNRQGSAGALICRVHTRRRSEIASSLASCSSGSSKAAVRTSALGSPDLYALRSSSWLQTAALTPRTSYSPGYRFHLPSLTSALALPSRSLLNS